eukprot:Hpha_TRINITY_DN29830_c0_g1::TRINITY_DN29830_c0_g1_i1::g.2820::m.2820/K06675/SMC4; structural maintenance of chromosome 4
MPGRGRRVSRAMFEAGGSRRNVDPVLKVDLEGELLSQVVHWEAEVPKEEEPKEVPKVEEVDGAALSPQVSPKSPKVEPATPPVSPRKKTVPRVETTPRRNAAPPTSAPRPEKPPALPRGEPSFPAGCAPAAELADQLEEACAPSAKVETKRGSKSESSSESVIVKRRRPQRQQRAKDRRAAAAALRQFAGVRAPKNAAVAAALVACAVAAVPRRSGKRGKKASRQEASRQEASRHEASQQEVPAVGSGECTVDEAPGKKRRRRVVVEEVEEDGEEAPKPVVPIALNCAADRDHYLVLERLQLSGFKSFREEETIEFDPRLTCIVGVNGSGKSNIIDSICFLFGMKCAQLRCNVLSELVNDETKRGRSNAQAAVLATFAERAVSGGALRRRFALRRVVTAADGDTVRSDYTCFEVSDDTLSCGTAMPRQEVASLLRRFGVDLDFPERFVVLQQHTEKLVQAKPLNLLSHFEELIGTAELREACVEVNDKLSRTIAASELLKGEKRDLEQLRAACGPAVAQLLEHHERILAVKADRAGWFHFACEYFSAAGTGAEERLKKAQTVVEEALGKQAAAERGEDAAQESLKAALLQAEGNDARRSELTALSDETTKALNTAKRRGAHLHRAVREARQELEELRPRAEAHRHSAEEAAQKCSAEEEALAIARERAATLSRLQDEQVQRAAQIRERADACTQDEGGMQQLRAELEEASAVRSSLQGKKLSLQRTGQEAAERFQSLQGKLREAQQEEATCAEGLAATQKLLGEQQQGVERQRRVCHDVRSGVCSLEVQGTRLQSGEAELLKRARDESGSGASLRAANSAACIGRHMLAGTADARLVHGFFYNWVCVEPRYHLAANGALCGALHTALCETTRAAEGLIARFKRENAGWVTCEVLRQGIPATPPRALPVGAPAGCQPMMEVLRLRAPPGRERLLEAVRRALQRHTYSWAVAPSTQDAWRLRDLCAAAGQSVNIAAADGTLLRSGGELTGGYTQGRLTAPYDARPDGAGPAPMPDSKGGGASRPNDELERVRKELRSIAAQLSTAREQQQRAEDTLTSREQVVSNLKATSERHEHLRMAARERVEELRRQIEDEQRGLAQLRLSDEEEQRLQATEAECRRLVRKLSECAGEGDAAVLASESLQSTEADLRAARQALEERAAAVDAARRHRIASERKVAVLEKRVCELERASAADEASWREKITGLKQKAEAAAKDMKKAVGAAASSHRRAVELRLRADEAEEEVGRHVKATAAAEADAADAQDQVEEVRRQRDKLLAQTDADAEAEDWDRLREKWRAKYGDDLQRWREVLLRKRDEVETALSVLLHSLSALDDDVLQKDVVAARRLTELAGEIAQQEKESDRLSRELESHETQRYQLVRRSLDAVNMNLTTVYRELTHESADCALTYPESNAVFSAGIAFAVRLPHTTDWKAPDRLSGGQRALAATALALGLQRSFPSPFYFFDEIDAALDAAHAEKIASVLRRAARVGELLDDDRPNPQFICISLRHQMYEQADRMVGVYQCNGTSRAITKSFPDS